jgi:hypothetical protein
MEHAKHIIRAVLLLVLVATVFVVARDFATPEGFGSHGTHNKFRLGSVAEYAAQKPMHGAPGACAGACHAHDNQVATVSGGKHASVQCEVCHAPLYARESEHVKAGEKVADMPMRRSHTLCGWCHERLAARPEKFPQVVLVEHVTEKGEEMSENVCLECHDAHNPSE